jgi:IS30 family transposase
MGVVVPMRKPFPKLACSECGTEVTAGCHCGAPYLTQGERAEAGLKKHPDWTNRRISEVVNVSHSTVNRVHRKLRSGTNVPLLRNGKGGKKYHHGNSQRGQIERLNEKFPIKVTAKVTKAKPVGRMPDDTRERVEGSIEKIKVQLEKLYELFRYADQMSPELCHLFADELNTIRTRAGRYAKQLIGGRGNLRKIARPLCHVDIPLRKEKA